MKYAIDPQPVHTYDPDKAKSLLKEAGMENLKVDFSAPPMPPSPARWMQHF